MRLAVVGAGGHAKVVVDAAVAAGWTVLGAADADPARAVFGLPHLGRPEALELPPDTLAVLAVGSNEVRLELARRLEERLGWATIVHPAAVVSPWASLAPGTVVFAGAVVQAEAIIGPHAILNTGCRVDHDCRVDAYCHVGPGAVLAGNVALEEGAFVGAGAVVTPGRRVGAWATLGAGGVAVRDLAPGLTHAGVPARPLPKETP